MTTPANVIKLLTMPSRKSRSDRNILVGLRGIAGHDQSTARVELGKVRGNHREQVKEPCDFGGGMLCRLYRGGAHGPLLPAGKYTPENLSRVGQVDGSIPKSRNRWGLVCVKKPPTGLE
jgi:hypothetical protein